MTPVYAGSLRDMGHHGNKRGEHLRETENMSILVFKSDVNFFSKFFSKSTLEMSALLNGSHLSTTALAFF